MDYDHFHIQKLSVHNSNCNCILNLFKIKDMLFHTDLNLSDRNYKQQMNEDKTGLLKINWTPGQQVRGNVGKCQRRIKKVNVVGKLLQHSKHK